MCVKAVENFISVLKKGVRIRQTTYRLVGGGEDYYFVETTELQQEISGVGSDLVYNFRDQLVHLGLSWVPAHLDSEFVRNLLCVLCLLRFIVVNQSFVQV